MDRSRREVDRDRERKGGRDRSRSRDRSRKEDRRSKDDSRRDRGGRNDKDRDRSRKSDSKDRHRYISVPKRQNPVPLHFVRLRYTALKFSVHFSSVLPTKVPQKQSKVVTN